ncbi:hypothetical protein AB0F96_30215 [Streptomyces sp. NPDC023998]|uniref:hypothetical protein n=1 Tax=Streptomyces sp. NPDC023998 TaxID=3154597 RepID=UPI0033CC0E9A
MESTRITEQAEEARAPLTDAEQEQAAYALRELASSESDPDALRVPHEQLEMIRPFFELGWAMGVRTGHTGPAMSASRRRSPWTPTASTMSWCRTSPS